MDFKKIKITEIHPFVRCGVFADHLVHTDYVSPLEHRVFYIEQGGADFWVKDKHYKLQKNDVFYVSVGTPYKMEAFKESAIFVLYFDMTMKNSNFKERIKPRGIVHNSDFLCQFKLIDKNGEVDYLYLNSPVTVKWINRIKLQSIEDISNEYVISKLSGLVTILLSEMLDNQNMTIKRKSFVYVAEFITDYIHKNYSKKIVLEDFEELLNFHKNYLNRCFKKYTGVSIYKYLLNYRLEKATYFLMYTGMSVNEVAEKVGFENSKSFSTAFKKAYLITPSSLLGVKYKK